MTGGSTFRMINFLYTRTMYRATQAWRVYVSLLVRYPGRSHAANTCILMSAGDVISQVVLERRPFKDYDLLRTARFALVGAVLFGPSMHVWYSALDRWTLALRGTTVATRAVTMMLADQVLFMPAYIWVYIVVMSALGHDDVDRIRGKVSRDFRPCLTASYGLWPAVQLFNFYMVPLRHRIFLINVVALFWNSLMGWKTERTLTKPCCTMSIVNSS